MRWSFWQDALVLSTIVYCKYHGLFCQHNGQIKYNKYLSTTHMHHTTIYINTIIFHFPDTQFSLTFLCLLCDPTSE